MRVEAIHIGRRKVVLDAARIKAKIVFRPNRGRRR